LQLQTGGNLILDTAANTLNQTAAFGATRSSTVLGPAASLSVTGDAYLQTGGNFEQHAGSLAVGGDLTTRIGGNWDIGTQQTQESKHTLNVGGASSTHFVEDVGSSIKVGGVSDLRVSGDLIARGAQIDLGGGGSMIAGGNLELLAAKSTSTVDASSSSSSRGRSSSESRHLVDDTITATTLQSGNSLSLISGKDITLTGSTLSLSQGQATLAAIGSVNIGSETEQHINNSAESHSHSVMVSSSQGASESRRNTQLADGSTVSADSVLVQSGKDINITGSAIAATNDVTLRAANNVTINDATSTDEQSSKSRPSAPIKAPSRKARTAAWSAARRGI